MSEQHHVRPEVAHTIHDLNEASRHIASAAEGVGAIEDLNDLDLVRDAAEQIGQPAGDLDAALAVRREEIEAENQDDEELGLGILAVFIATRAYALGRDGEGFTSSELRTHLNEYIDFGNTMDEKHFEDLFGMVRHGITEDTDEIWIKSEAGDDRETWILMPTTKDAGGKGEASNEQANGDIQQEQPQHPGEPRMLDAGQQKHILDSALRLLQPPYSKSGLVLSDLISRASNGVPGEIDPDQTRSFIKELHNLGILAMTTRNNRTIVTLVPGKRLNRKAKEALLAELADLATEM